MLDPTILLYTRSSSPPVLSLALRHHTRLSPSTALSRFSLLHRYTIPRLANLQLVAHVNEESKRELLTRAWFVVNLSVHEGLAISFLEALACEAPIVALVDPGGLVSSYGRYVGAFPGDGMEALPGLKQAFVELLSNQSLRRDLGARGRRHVQFTHNEARFLDCFDRLLQRLCVPSTSAKCARLPRPNSDDGETTKQTLSVHRTSALDVSVVIPSFDRMQTLHLVLVAILRSESFEEGSTSEILIAHASNESLSARVQIQRATAEACGSCDLSRIRHLDFVELNAVIGCTVRYFAATHARTPIIIHLDDDIVVSSALLTAMARAVTTSSGAPLAGPTQRRCGAEGYCIFPSPNLFPCTTDPIFVLTNVAAVPYGINAHFVAAYKEGILPYDQLMTRTHGNGCDLIFNAFLYDHGLGEPKAVGTPGAGEPSMVAAQMKQNQLIFTYVDAESQPSGGYQNKRGHMSTRRAICRCFATGRLASAPPPHTNVGQHSDQICDLA